MSEALVVKKIKSVYDLRLCECRYVDDQFYPTYAATIGIDFKVKNLVVDDRRVRVQIW